MDANAAGCAPAFIRLHDCHLGGLASGSPMGSTLGLRAYIIANQMAPQSLLKHGDAMLGKQSRVHQAKSLGDLAWYSRPGIKTP